jgi:glycosyltransferase involved in cell wall biosynthesis
MPKAVVCFSGSRDCYQLALALEEAGLLEKLVTDFYWEPRQVPFGESIAARFPKLIARYAPGLRRSQVMTPPGATFDSLLMRTAFASENRQIRLDCALGRRARDVAWQSQAAVFSYSYYAAAAFAPGTRQPHRRFLFQLHPHPAVVRQILREEMVRVPRFASSLKWEHEIGAPETHFRSLCAEARLANGWVVASSFTARTLANQGIPRDKIQVVPYGVDTTTYPCRDRAPSEKEPFRVIWVGSMAQRKGLSYCLEAVGSLPQENLEVLVCGRQAVDRAAIEEYGIKSVRVLQGLRTPALTRLLRSCDMFVLPSLAEGFGHAILEAMSSGLPVITTTSTCAPDVLQDGAHGFLVPIRDSRSIAEKINWGRTHRTDLYRMGLAGAAQVRTFTWARFRSGIVKAYSNMLQGTEGEGSRRRGLAKSPLGLVDV